MISTVSILDIIRKETAKKTLHEKVSHKHVTDFFMLLMYTKGIYLFFFRNKFDQIFSELTDPGERVYINALFH